MNDNIKLFQDLLEEIKQELEGNFRIEVSDEDGCFSLRLVKTFDIKEKFYIQEVIHGVILFISFN